MKVREYDSLTENRIRSYFRELKFEERRHLYTVDGKILPSVTGIVESLSPKFNENLILPLSANKQGRDPEELRMDWRLKAKEGRELGTNVHKFMERYSGFETPTVPQERAGVKYIKSLEGEYRISLRELRAFSRRFSFAGTMDLPLYRISTGNFTIDDYKTNRTDLFKAYSYMLQPFNYLESSPYNKYQLQLSCYQVMLEEVGIVIENRRLVHLQDDGEFKTYDLWDFSNELREYFNSIAC